MKKQLSLILFFICISASSIASDVETAKQEPKDAYVQFMQSNSNGVTPQDWSLFIQKNINSINKKNVNAADPKGQTALHVAVQLQSETNGTVKALLQYKADIHAQDFEGNTPLHKATQSVHMNSELVQILIQAKANVSTKNKKGNTPLNVLAKSHEQYTKKHNSIRDFLQSATEKDFDESKIIQNK